MDAIPAFVAFFELISDCLDERTKRLLAAAAVKSLPRGGATAIAAAMGISRTVIYDGLAELKGDLPVCLNKQRQRREGAGSKKLTDKNPSLISDLESLIKPYERGDPESCLKWTCRSLRNLSDDLAKKGHKVSYVTVGKLLENLDYTLQSNRKSQEGGTSRDRDKQFEHIYETASAFVDKEQPVISVDAKKKELIGNFKNNGREYRAKGKPREVLVYDFVNENGRATPYGIYDINANEGFVNVGTSHDTAKLAVDSIRCWWHSMGCLRYPYAHSLYINADGVGSNSSRNRMWKSELQKLADDLQLYVYVSHFPPGTSKWNKIEHRMFSFISMNWRGRPLTSIEVIVNLIASTKTDAGLRIQAQHSAETYNIGEKISDEELYKLNILTHDLHPEWNYVIMPQRNVV